MATAHVTNYCSMMVVVVATEEWVYHWISSLSRISVHVPNGIVTVYCFDQSAAAIPHIVVELW